MFINYMKGHNQDMADNEKVIGDAIESKEIEASKEDNITEDNNQFEIPKEITKSISQFGAMIKPSYPPFMDKIEPQHISDIIKGADKFDEREFNDKKSTKRYMFAYCLIAVALIIFFTVFFKSDPDMLRLIITFLIGLGSGIAGGYGIGSRKRS